MRAPLRLSWPAVLLATLEWIHPQVACATPFVTDIIPEGRGRYSSIAIDSHGNLHVAFQGTENLDLVYATFQRGQWHLEPVDTVGVVGGFASIGIDSHDTPHISYYDETKQDLKHATRLGVNRWQTTAVDTGGNIGQYTSLIAFDGSIYIAYYDVTNGNLKVASGPTWAVQMIDGSATDVGQYCSVGVEPLTGVHVSYFDATNRSLKYAVGVAGNWSSQTVDGSPSTSVGTFSSIAVANSGVAVISYMDVLNGDLKLATRVGTTWVLETVESAGRVGLYSSLRLAADDAPCIAFYDSTNRSLRFATKSGSSWTVDFVTPVRPLPGPDVGRYSSLALDRHANPVVAFQDSTNLNLEVADSRIVLLQPTGSELWRANSTELIRWQGTGPVTVEFSTDGGVSYNPVATDIIGNLTSILVPSVITDAARVRISRQTPQSASESATLSITGSNQAVWWPEIVSAGDDLVGCIPSLRLNANDMPGIAYHDNVSARLKFARRVASSWVTDVLDTAQTRVSLAFDLGGVPHIVYMHPATKLWHTWKTGPATWQKEPIDSSIAINYPSLGVDQLGNLCVAYQNVTSKDVRFARKAVGGSWVVEVVDTTGSVGDHVSLALDRRGDAHIAYRRTNGAALKYARRHNGEWSIEFIDASGGASTGRWCSIAIDPDEVPHVAYQGDVQFGGGAALILYASPADDGWETEVVEAVSFGEGGDSFTSLAIALDGTPYIAYYSDILEVAYRDGNGWHDTDIDHDVHSGFRTSIAIDSYGNPRIAHTRYYISGEAKEQLRYASSAIEVTEPSPGASWPVASRRTVTWDGLGTVSLYLSTDGGLTYNSLAAGIAGGRHQFTVPNVGATANFCKIKLERTLPRSIAVSDSFFSITAYVGPGVFAVEPLDEGPGALLSWETEPGLPDIAGYEVARAVSNGWEGIMPLARVTSLVDRDASHGSRYQLTAVNNAGQRFVVGQATLTLQPDFVAEPTPSVGGRVHLQFRILRGDQVDLGLFDVSGRRVATIVRGPMAQGLHKLSWDGRASTGSIVPGGLYFARLVQAGSVSQRKVVVVH